MDRFSYLLHEKALSVNGRRGGPPLLLTYLFSASDRNETNVVDRASIRTLGQLVELGAC
jgi:hypothetical protein